MACSQSLDRSVSHEFFAPTFSVALSCPMCYIKTSPRMLATVSRQRVTCPGRARAAQTSKWSACLGRGFPSSPQSSESCESCESSGVGPTGKLSTRAICRFRTCWTTDRPIATGSSVDNLCLFFLNFPRRPDELTCRV